MYILTAISARRCSDPVQTKESLSELFPYTVALHRISNCCAELFFADTLFVLNSQQLANCFTSAGESFSCGQSRTA
jgi:hypothetical protein